MAIRKGHTIEFETISTDNNNYQTLNINETQKEKEQREKVTNLQKRKDIKNKKLEQLKELSPTDLKYLEITKEDIIYGKIEEAKDICENEYFNLTDKQQQNKLTQEEKFQMSKYHLKKKLGFDNIKLEQIKIFYNKSYLINNFKGLIDEKNIDDDRENKLQQINIVKSILNDLTFANMFDDKVIDHATFNKLLLKFQKENIIYTDFNNVKSYFHMAKEPKQNKMNNNITVMDYINSILKNFNIKISGNIKPGKKNEAKNMIYSIEILNNIQEIIEYLMLKGYKIEDREKIFKPLSDDKKIYKDLVHFEKGKTVDMFNDDDIFNDK
jgi:hypothetical protein